MTRVRRAGRVTFAALTVPNYRRYVYGQAVSLSGTWMQMTAISWLVYRLSDSATILGVIVALQTLPVLILGPYGGVVADRVNKRRLTIALQAIMGLQALALGLLTVTGRVQVWEIGILAAVLGLNNAFENPARQSFMLELVGPEHLRNAVSLNSVMVNAARSLGPAMAGPAHLRGRGRLVLSAQRLELSLRDLLADHHGYGGADALDADPASPRPAARGPRLRAQDADPARAPGDDGRRRVPDL